MSLAKLMELNGHSTLAQAACLKRIIKPDLESWPLQGGLLHTPSL